MRFFRRRLILGLVNLLAGPPTFAPLQLLRVGLLGILGMKVGCRAQISEQFYVLNGDRVSIGDEGRIGSFCRIWDFSEVSIGDNLLASQNLTIIAGTHHTSDLSPRRGPISIGNDVWIGISVTIVGPVRIGNRCFIGAGALVISDIPDDAIAAGVPAKILRFREPPAGGTSA
jgi:acetyltransferase-like isoleucine patch superfamily enzyme